MTAKFDLKWDDLVSPTMNPDNYLEQFKDKIESNYNTYEPKSEVLEKIKNLLSKNKAKLKIVA